MITIKEVKRLREETGVSITECQKALTQAQGDLEKAKEILRKWGQELANKISDKETKQGVIESYIHPNKKIGVLLDVRCQSDFVARSKEFQSLVHDLALHIAGMNPIYVKPEDIPQSFLDKEKEIYQEQFIQKNKPKDLIEKMVQGKLNKYKKESCLLSQPFIKDSSKTVKEYIDEQIAQIGENIVVKRFIRYQID